MNRKARLLVHGDPTQPARYLRQLVLQLARQPGPSPVDWETVQIVTLPPGTYVVPAALTGLVANPSEWKRVSDPTDDLVSDLFANQALTYALDGDAGAQAWIGVAFTPNHTLAALGPGPPPKGFIVVAQGREHRPDPVQVPRQEGEPDVRREQGVESLGGGRRRGERQDAQPRTGALALQPIM